MTYIYGIGRPTAQKILTEAGVEFDSSAICVCSKEAEKKRCIRSAMR